MRHRHAEPAPVANPPPEAPPGPHQPTVRTT